MNCFIVSITQLFDSLREIVFLKTEMKTYIVDGVVELMEHINKENEEDNEVPDMDIDDIKAFLDE